jgi:hypothetical protein
MKASRLILATVALGLVSSIGYAEGDKPRTERVVVIAHRLDFTLPSTIDEATIANAVIDFDSLRIVAPVLPARYSQNRSQTVDLALAEEPRKQI